MAALYKERREELGLPKAAVLAARRAVSRASAGPGPTGGGGAPPR